MTSARRFASVVAVLLILMGPGAVHADLYTDAVLSLEWLVDSSDEIYLVRFTKQPSSAGPLTSTPIRALKSQSSVTELSDSDVQFYQRRFAEDGDEWLLFVRTAEDNTPTVVRGVNLTRPLQFVQTAAVTSDGVPLPDKKCIMDAVEKRVQLKRTLPDNCVRHEIDAFASTNHDGKRVLFETCVGGFPVEINCGYWDDGGPYDCDLLICWAVVPADPEFYPVLLRTLSEKHSSAHLRELYVYALVNYPGEQTEAVLEKIVSDGTSSQKRIAQRLLTHLKYRQGLTDPLNKTLVGQWRIVGRREQVDLTFDSDNTCAVTVHERSGTIHGKGYWAVRDGRLWIRRTHYQDGDRWRAGIREFFKPKLIEQVTSTDVILEDGPPMKRR